MKNRRCGKCESDNTITNWYRDEQFGFLCGTCYDKKRYNNGLKKTRILIHDRNRLHSFKKNHYDASHDVLGRIVDFYFNNRFDPVTRHELLSKIPKVR